MKRKLPMVVTVELLRHMSEEGRFDQTLSDFPNLELQEIRETFAWLALQVEQEVRVGGEADRKTVAKLCRSKLVSPTTRKVLDQLSPEEGRALLQNFGLVPETT